MHLKTQRGGFRHLTSSLCIFIIINLSLPPTLSTDEQRYVMVYPSDCTEMNESSQCTCAVGPTHFEIKCPKPLTLSSEAKMTIYTPHGSVRSVNIECAQMNAREYKIMPAMDIGDTQAVRLRQCPLPSDAPFIRVFEKLGITNTKDFFFESDDLGMNLTRNHLHGLEKLQRLCLSSKNLAHLQNDLFMDLKNLPWLELRAHDIELPVDIFAPLENLGTLELARNNLTDLPAGIFRNQRKLKKLNLWSNRLSQLRKENFEGLTALTDLDLSVNGIETLESDIFDLLPNLSNIHLSSNRFHKLPKGLFANTKNLSFFRLGNNRVPLVTLPEGLLSNLPALQEIRLTCDLETLPGDVFANSSNIINISLSNNKITSLPMTLFSDQFKLTKLDLSNNRLTDLPDGLFRHTKELKVLTLTNNQLQEISRGIFLSLVSLEELYINNNRLTTIDPNAFYVTQSLTELHLQNNFIELPLDSQSPFHKLTRLHKLNLRNNSLTYLYYDWKTVMDYLDTLDLSYNKISHFHYSDIQFFSKKPLTVNLSHNQIRYIDFTGASSIGPRDPTKPLIVDINNNPLHCDCMLPSFVKYLREYNGRQSQYIEIRAQNLTCIEPENLQGKVAQAVSLMDLLCPLDSPESETSLCPTNCECFIRSIDRTLLVNCSNGNRSEVPKLPDLRNKSIMATELDMTNNKLMRLPSGRESGYGQVTKLMISGNNISTLDVSRLPQNLTHLDLSDNFLQVLNESVLTYLAENRKFVSIQLADNPWLCDCQAKPLISYMQVKYANITDLKQIQCAAPLEGKYFKDLSITEICPEDKSLVIFLAIVIALFGFLIGLIAALYYKYQMEIKVWLYAHNMCLWFVTEEDLDKDKLYDAFVSYSSLDEAFILQQLVPKLEQSKPKFRLLIHSRDWPVGATIPTQITNSVNDSKRTIILLSKNFIESVWALMEFRLAHRSALKEKKSLLIVIVYDDIGNIDKLDNELKAYLNSNTYLRWGDPWFWEKLRYAMPHKSPKMDKLIKNSLKSAIDDKLELINPSPVTPPLTTPPVEQTKTPWIAHLNGNTPQTAIMIANGKTGQMPAYYMNGKANQNGHINGAFVINTNAKQSDV